MKQLYFILLFLILAPFARAQAPDSTLKLGEVEVTAYRSQRPLLTLPASVSVVSAEQMALQPGATLVPVMNSVPGVRMEERSPGSYRLSIRGSLLRSPFGVRNVKVYIDEFPFTDAGGNTYFNSIEPNSITGLEIVKGPEASIYGANTGGVVLLKPYDANDTARARASLSAGSYGLMRESITAQNSSKNYFFNFSQGFQRSDGYRDHSAMQRHYAHTMQRWEITEHHNIRLFALYSNLNYETPGGLTLEQFETAPRAARPRKGTIPGAEEQKAGVHNETGFAGLVHEAYYHPRLRHVIAFTGMRTNFKNPFITNYEERDESTLGLRSYLEWKSSRISVQRWKAYLGIEGQQTRTDIANYDNDLGHKGQKQSAATVKAQQHFAFAQYWIALKRKWNIEAAVSFNLYRYDYRNKAPITETSYNEVKLDSQLMPRLALSYSITQDFAWRASASRGYSPPTIAEIRPSTDVIYTGIQPEHGWNYETGFRFRTLHERLWMDAALFYFALDDAIVRRVNDQDEEYFVNAGGTKQPGFESQLYFWILPAREQGFVRAMQLTQSYTYHDFSFESYSVGNDDHSGNDVTGVAKHAAVSGIEIRMKGRLFVFAQHSYTSAIPLDDANTSYADAYHLVQLKSGWRFGKKGRENFQVFAGADNLLDEKYSLGNDLNAAAGRYYNAAAGRNYYIGVKGIF